MGEADDQQVQMRSTVGDKEATLGFSSKALGLQIRGRASGRYASDKMRALWAFISTQMVVTRDGLKMEFIMHSGQTHLGPF